VRITPNHLDVLLHFYVSAEPHPRAHAPAVQQAIADWCEMGMLDGRPGPSPTTEKAHAWIEHLLRTPLPVAEWVIPPHEESA
jgi:hypothetical protein